MTKIKRSYGIICCRQHPIQGLQMILIKKSVTYHYCEFVSGHYRKSDTTHLQKLFNNMTYSEKIDILSLNFAAMWYRVYHTTPDQVFLQSSNSYVSKQYISRKNKFELSFLQDRGQRLKSLISDSINVETTWELPKGRKRPSSDESDLDAAIREFSEETLISPDHYEIIYRLKPYIETYTDFGVTYQNIYYYAKSVGEWSPCIKFNNNMQISEVSAIRWSSINDLSHMTLEKTTYQRLVKMFKKVSKKFKNYRKYSQYNSI